MSTLETHEPDPNEDAWDLVDLRTVAREAGLVLEDLEPLERVAVEAVLTWKLAEANGGRDLLSGLRGRAVAAADRVGGPVARRLLAALGEEPQAPRAILEAPDWLRELVGLTEDESHVRPRPHARRELEDYLRERRERRRRRSA